MGTTVISLLALTYSSLTVPVWTVGSVFLVLCLTAVVNEASVCLSMDHLEHSVFRSLSFCFFLIGIAVCKDTDETNEISAIDDEKSYYLNILVIVEESYRRSSLKHRDLIH